MLVGLLNEATVAGPRFTAAAVEEIPVVNSRRRGRIRISIINKAFLALSEEPETSLAHSSPPRHSEAVGDVTIALSLHAGKGLPPIPTNLVNARIRWGSHSVVRRPPLSSLSSRWQEAIYLSSLCATRQAWQKEGGKEESSLQPTR